MPRRQRSDTWLLLIGAFKLVKAAILIVVATGAVELLHHRAADPIREIAHVAHIDPDSRLVRWLVSQVASLSPHRLLLMSIGTYAYAALFVVEGVGLIRRKRWGELVTVVITGSFVPWEIYEAVHRESAAKLGLLALNLAIVGYLIWRLRSDAR